MKRDPRITLGLLVYNGDRYLAQTIESLLAQTYGDFRLVISDNASADGTEDICRRFAAHDHRVAYIRQSENIGAMRNFNYLASLADAPYFKWCAADDLLGQTFLARCIGFLESNPDYVLCHTSTRTIGFDNREMPNDIIKPSGASERVPNGLRDSYPPWRRFRDVLLGNTAVMDLWGVVRTAALQDTGLLRAYVGYEKVLMAALSIRGRFAELPQHLFSYRIHPDSMSSSVDRDTRQQWCTPGSSRAAYPRLQYLIGYLDVINQSEMSTAQKTLCRAAVGRYLLQVSKWQRLLMESVFGRPIYDGNAEILKANVAAQRSGGDNS